MQTRQSLMYRNTVRQCAMDMAGQGGFTVSEFAKKCDFRLTHNLRRRLAEMVKEGLLQATPAYTENGRMATYFHLPVPTQQLSLWQEIPF